MSVIIGLTGGIGSGKSTVAKIFANLGVPVFNADKAAKDIMNTSLVIKNSLIEKFGAAVYKQEDDVNGNSPFVLNSAYLSKIVFSDPFKLAQLNEIVHPVTIQAALDWAAKQNATYVIKEAALFFESGSTAGTHKIIGVYAPKAVRIHRVMKRDHCSKEDVEKRMMHQIDESIKMKLCDWVIMNDEQQLLLPQVIELHNEILQLVSTI